MLKIMDGIFHHHTTDNIFLLC